MHSWEEEMLLDANRRILAQDDESPRNGTESELLEKIKETMRKFRDQLRARAKR